MKRMPKVKTIPVANEPKKEYLKLKTVSTTSQFVDIAESISIKPLDNEIVEFEGMKQEDFDRLKKYNESYEDVVPFRKNTLIKTFDMWKNAYKNKNEEEIAKFSRIDQGSLAEIYNYVLRQSKLEVLLDKTKIQISDYFFMRTDKSRTAFVCISWDGYSPFLIPPGVDILYFNEPKNKKYIAMTELQAKAEKHLKTIDGYGNLRMVDVKSVPKLRKILVKSKFAPLTVELKEIKLKDILDV
jgi:hypothetical protein